MKRLIIIRNANLGDLLESFLVSSVISILVIRIFLYFTNYPQLGGKGLHIAHMLWGGFFMGAAIVMLLSFLGMYVKQIAAVVGGIGFGMFIDELGKFITSDNNYFFQPTIAILYIIFLLLFFTFRYIEHHRELTDKECLMNSLELLGEAVQNDMDPEEKNMFVSFLQKAGSSNTFRKHFIALSEEIDLVETPIPSAFTRAIEKSIQTFDRLIQSNHFQNIIIIFFVLYGIIALVSAGLILYAFVVHNPVSFDMQKSHNIVFTFDEIISTVMSAILIVIGIGVLRFSRFKAYLLFKYSTLISILITHFFVFYREQLSALFGLVWNILILLCLNYMLSLEQLRRKNDR